MLSSDRIGALVLLAFSIGYGAMIYQIPLLPFQRTAAFTAQTLPQALSVMGIVLSLVLLFTSRNRDMPDVAGYHWLKGGLICGLMVAYGFLVRPAGFILSTGLFLIFCELVLGERRWKILIFSTMPVVLFFWYLMNEVLGVYVAPLPEFLVDMRG
ncbi:MAG: tripartite tricarboxylate transporter TctB family protein [Rhizobiales bacterium]|nr:tripartite tricarboxylate transporter TctB family protein [Hyphomicrobiales bacterium]NRB13135.1 tripartite tricarboxylate transporter TctB family protein [Hyphomicrobiales bacterium]